MSNKAVVLIEDVEVGVEKALSFLTKETKAAPAAVAALGTLVGAADAALTSVEAAASGGLSLALDAAAIANIKSVWPQVKAFMATVGVKL